jgi:hypothetical protein
VGCGVTCRSGWATEGERFDHRSKRPEAASRRTTGAWNEPNHMAPLSGIRSREVPDVQFEAIPRERASHTLTWHHQQPPWIYRPHGGHPAVPWKHFPLSKPWKKSVWSQTRCTMGHGRRGHWSRISLNHQLAGTPFGNQYYFSGGWSSSSLTGKVRMADSGGYGSNTFQSGW